MEPLALTGLIALVAGAIWVATRPAPSPPPLGGYAMQMRPIPPSSPFVPAQIHQTIIATSQKQLQALGYPIARTDGVMDAASQAATTQFINTNAQAIVALQQQLRRTDDGVALTVLDNQYRQKYGLPVSVI